MTLRHLMIFSTVCRLGSITQAAEELNMAQPSVSLAIRELESYYGIRLFERMHRRLYITEAGERLYGYANSILTQCKEAKEAGAVVNNASDRTQCDFYFPGLIRRGPAVIGINAGGADHKLAKALRIQIEKGLKSPEL